MSRAFLILASATVLTGVLAGCSSNDEDLRQWMAEQRRVTTPKVTPLTEPTRYVPLVYAGGAAVDAFSTWVTRSTMPFCSGLYGVMNSCCSP